MPQQTFPASSDAFWRGPGRVALAMLITSSLALAATPEPLDGSGRVPSLRLEDGGWSSQFGWGLGCNGPIERIIESPDGGYYVGGRFGYCGDAQVNNIAHFDPESGVWTALGSDGGNGVRGEVRNIAVYRGELVVQGGFDAVNVGPDSQPTKSFATWNGSNWTAYNDIVYGMLSNAVFAMAVVQDVLILGGYIDFHLNNGRSVQGLAVWDGESIEGFGPNESANVNGVFAMAEFRGELYVGGLFRERGGIRRWTGSEWAALGTDGGIGLDTSARDLVVWNDALYATGSFTTANFGADNSEVEASRVARWDGNEWSALGAGLDDLGLRLAATSDRLLVAGRFTMAGGVSAPHIASWDGQRWSPAAAELFHSYPILHVNTMVDTPAGVLVGGHFSNAAADPVSGQPEIALNGIGLIDQGVWRSWAGDVGNGVYGDVRAFARFQGDLYVGGEFRTIGRKVVNGIARWDGAQWQAVGSGGGKGVDGAVTDLQATPEGLYVSGRFRSANPGGQEVVAGSVARWDGERWHGVGSGDETGVFGTVETMLWAEPDLYVGGTFGPPPEGESGFPAYNVARWDGSRWSLLGDESGNGVGRKVRAMAMLGNDLYVGGDIGGASLNPDGPAAVMAMGLARWDGSQWHSVGATGIGLDYNGFPDFGVFAMAVKGSDLYVGGGFYSAEARGPAPIPVRGLVRWDGAQWHNIGGAPEIGVNGTVHALAFIGESLVVGGSFNSIEIELDSDTPAPNIAYLENDRWVTSASGLRRPVGISYVSTLFPEPDGGLYVGGFFDQAGGKASVGIAYHRPDAPNYSYIYWNPSEPGWGYNLQHQGDLLYGTWYSYADDGQPMFLTVEALAQADGSFAGPVYRTAGTPFAQINGMSALTAVTEVGQAMMSFDADGLLALSYTVNGVSQSKQLERFIFDAAAPSCFGTSESRADASNYSDLWWNDSEPGWGLTLSHQGDTIFALWYTYGEGGRDQWISASALTRLSDGSYLGALQRPQSGTPLAQIMGAPATSFPVPEIGTMQLRFNDGENGFLGYAIDGVSQNKAIKRFVVVGPDQTKPLCAQ